MAASEEPLSSWLIGVGAAAQELHDGRAEASAREARAALSARPTGAAAERARLALELASAALRGPGPEPLSVTEPSVPVAPEVPADRVALARAMELAALGRMAEAEAMAGPLVAGTGVDPGVRRGATWVLARAASRAGRHAEASGRYAEVAASRATVPGLELRRSVDLGDEAAYLSAWSWYDAGDFKKASARLDAFVRSHPRSPRAEDARWFSAWSSWRRGDPKAARAALSRLESSGVADAAFYWQGRLAESTALAQDRYTRAAIAGGDGWYGWLARARLRALDAPVPPWSLSVARIDGPPDDLTAGRLGQALELLERGQRERGDQALALAVQLASDRGAAAIAVCELAAFAGDHDLAYRVARDSLGVTSQSLRWLYPEAFGDRLRLPAEALALDPDLLLAVIRRESAFRAEARSMAGAVGLGQLLPTTADRLLTLSGVTADGGPRLTEPGPNLASAAHYLALLQDRFGDEASALAAYNAGPRVVASWPWDPAGLTLDEWVEDVPYRETRHYLKLVLAARERYRRLRGAPPDLDPARPVPAPGDGVAF